MVDAFDRIVISVPDLAAARSEYERLLGLESRPASAGAGGETAWLALPNTVIELRQSPVQQALISGIVFRSEDGGATDLPLGNDLQLDIALSDGEATAAFRGEPAARSAADMRVDHLVLRTNDAQGCINLFRDELGVRLALDQTVPEWGGRMLFFRTGKLTLEVIESSQELVAENTFWGIAYQCQDLEQVSQALQGRGCALSEIREGRKPGTRVATVKSHCLAIPTLLVQPAT